MVLGLEHWLSFLVFSNLQVHCRLGTLYFWSPYMAVGSEKLLLQVQRKTSVGKTGDFLLGSLQGLFVMFGDVTCLLLLLLLALLFPLFFFLIPP